MPEIPIEYIETGNIIIPPKKVTQIPVRQFGIKKVVVVRTRQNGGIPEKK